MVFVHISVFSALFRTLICLPCPGKKCFLLQNIVQKFPPGVSRCTLLLTQRVSALPPLLAWFYSYLPLLHFVPEGSILLHYYRGRLCSHSLQGRREVALRWLSCASIGCDRDMSVVMDWPRMLLCWGCSFPSKSSSSSCRNEAQCLKCTVK